MIKPGPLQKMWLSYLRDYPERQTRGKLGHKDSKHEYKACCLGELHVCYHRMHNLPLPFEDGYIHDGFDAGCLIESYEKYGLKSPSGLVGNKWSVNSLATWNDKGKSWPEIADFIEQNPEAVFSKSV